MLCILGFGTCPGSFASLDFKLEARDFSICLVQVNRSERTLSLITFTVPIVMGHFPLMETVKQVKTEVSPPYFLVLATHKRGSAVFATASVSGCDSGAASVSIQLDTEVVKDVGEGDVGGEDANDVGICGGNAHVSGE